MGEWFIDDIMSDNNSLSNESEDDNNNFLNVHKILINLYINMRNLKLNNIFINDVIINQLAKGNLSNEEINELEDEIKIYEEKNKK